MINTAAKIYVAGHQGMVGSAIMRQLIGQSFNNIVTQSHSELDLLQQDQVMAFFNNEKPDVVIIAAAKVGGIHANNTYPAEFIYENLMMECNLINSAHQHGCSDLLFLGSSCIYPRDAAQPMAESALLTGTLEATNEPYALAKIAGIKLCESYNRQYGTHYRSAMPTNLYGPGDNFHSENSHVIPALMRRIHEAKLNESKSVSIWGSGDAMREFLHVDDMAAACLHVMQMDEATYLENTEPMLSHINVGTGIDVTIRDLAETLAEVVGFNGELAFDSSKPDGTPRKLLDVGRLNALGWQAGTMLRQGLEQTYEWFLAHQDNFRQ